MREFGDGTAVNGAKRGGTGREVHIADLWAVVRRHWKLVVIVTALISGAAWFTGRGTIAQYQSQLTMQVTASKSGLGRTNDIDVDPLALQTDPILSEALVLTTHALARNVVKRLSLQLEMVDVTRPRAEVFANVSVDSAASNAPSGSYAILQSDPAEGWELRDGAGSVIDSGGYSDLVEGPGFSFIVLPPQDKPRTVRFRIVTPDQAASWVRGGIGYQVRQQTTAFDVTFTGTDPSLVPHILNQAAAALRLDGVERTRQATVRRRRFIELALDSARTRMRLALGSIQRFKQGQGISDLSTEEAALVGRIADVERDRMAFQVQISTLEDALAGTSSASVEALNQLSAVAAVRDNAALAFQINLLLHLYEERRGLTAGALGLRRENPKVEGIDEKIAHGHEALTGAADAALRALRGQEEAISARIAELRRELNQFADKENTFALLEVVAATSRETTRWLQAQLQLARIQEATIAPYLSILDGASPPVAIGTSVSQKIILGVLVGLLLGVAGSFFLEYLDQTIKTASDIERVIGAPVLGQIPYSETLFPRTNGVGTRLSTLIDLHPEDPPYEAFRALRTNVTFLGADKPVHFLAVTSPGPGEGKSTTAASLALTLAQSGHRTVLVDADLRRPQLHRAFSLIREPGLTDVLIGEATVREVVRPDVHDNFDVLPAGAIPPNPSELLGSGAMSELIAELRREYDYIVMDTPPILPVTDAVVMAAAADATIVVMRSGETEEVAAQRAIGQLQRVEARLTGIVLNGVSARFDHHYNYYSYSRDTERTGRSLRQSLRQRITHAL